MKRPEIRQVSFGQRVIAFELTYSERRRLAISVHPDLRVTVVAPLGRPEAQVLAHVRKRAGWIARNLDGFARNQKSAVSRRYVSGESFRYLGRQYRLKVQEGQPPSVKLSGPFLWVTTPDRRNGPKIALQLDRWYRLHAREIFGRKLAEVYERARAHGAPPPVTWRLQRMRSRWGSCTRARRILLSPSLAQAPLSSIEYVIAHEVCHLMEMNHGQRFERLLGMLCPGWQAGKNRLESMELNL
jgi:predicted metal-dependent hydrolase